MTVSVRQVLQSANTALQDDDLVRWPLTTLLEYLNDGLREIAIVKPNATSQTVNMELQEGSLQELADNHHALISVTRNIEANISPNNGTTSITTVSRELLDTQIPNWTNPNVLPFNRQVVHVVDDIADTGTFHVVPGNDGTGIIEVIVSVIPTPVATPLTDDNLFASYDGLHLDLSPVYQSPLRDYILHRAYEMDQTVPNSAATAQSFYAKFANALGVKLQAETIANTNTTYNRT